MEQNTLYRKYRPKNFDEVCGQEVIVRTLRNQIEQDKIGHAYLFCGTRGTGKTTIAKIFARAVNCKNKKNGNPCNECQTCLSILDASNLNVVELDAASNRGIDDIRRIISLSEYPPINDENKKVFIIDEAHSLSKDACNALLKTLEEPPSYVVFILCTTEPEKLLDTILSRCQRYDFTRIEIETIKKQLLKICENEDLQIDEDALSFIATKGDGSMRDSISILERCRGYIKDEKIDLHICNQVLGIVENDDFENILMATLKQDTKKVFEIIGEFIDNGKDIRQFVMDFVWYLRNLLVIKNINKPNEKLSITNENFNKLKSIASEITIENLIYFIEKLSELEHNLKLSLEKRVLLEMTFLKFTTPESDFSETSIMSRISTIETNISNSNYSQITATRDEFVNFLPKDKENKIVTELKFEKATLDELKKINDNKNEIIKNFGNEVKSLFKKCRFIPSLEKKEGEIDILISSEQNYISFLRMNQEHNILDLLHSETLEIIKKDIKYNIVNAEEEHISNEVILTSIESLGIPIEEEE